MYKAIIFDFDGVLVDTMTLHYKTWKKLAHFLSIPLNDSIIDKLRGSSRDKSLQLVLDQNNITATEAQKRFYSNMKDSWYQIEIRQMTKDILLPGVENILEELRYKKVKTVIASASKNANKIIHQIGMASYFDLILDANDIDKTKPDPSIFLHVLNLLDLNPNEVMIIEDSPLGVMAAKQAGCQCLGIGEANKLINADKVFDSMVHIKLEDLGF